MSAILVLRCNRRAGKLRAAETAQAGANKFRAGRVSNGHVELQAHAPTRAQQTAREVIKLKDGSTLYVFKDGKMAKKNRFFARLIQQVLRNMRQKRVLP